MGWCSGTDIAEKWFAQIRKHIPAAKQRAATYEMIDALRDQDWDCEDDFDDPVFLAFYAEYRAEHGETDD